MKGSLLLPIESRQSRSFLYVPTLEVDQPVEAGAQVDNKETSPGLQSESKEQEIDSRINKASLNAEFNRRMSSDFLQRDDPTPPLIEEADRGRISVKFGNESDLEYDAHASPNSEYRKTVRLSKEFDGNRSGRKSSKQ